MSRQQSKVKVRKFAMGEHAPVGTKHRVSACRKRLRQTRATQRALRLALDEAVLEADELLKLAPGEEGFSDSENVFEEAGASDLSRTRRFTPEVDRRTRLRAR